MNWKTTTSGLILVIFAGYLFALHLRGSADGNTGDILAIAVTSAITGIGLIAAKDGSNKY